MSLAKAIHLFTLAAWLGGMIHFSFVAAPHLFSVFPKETAGSITGALFPGYYVFGATCGVLSLLGFLLSARGPWSWASLLVAGLLTAMLLVTAVSGTLLRAKTHEVRAEMHAEQDEGRKADLQGRFGRLHGLSMVLNLLVMIFGCSAWILSWRIPAIP